MEWFIYALRNTFNYQGRAKRAEFIWFILIYELSDWADCQARFCFTFNTSFR